GDGAAEIHPIRRVPAHGRRYVLLHVGEEAGEGRSLRLGGASLLRRGHPGDTDQHCCARALRAAVGIEIHADSWIDVDMLCNGGELSPLPDNTPCSQLTMRTLFSCDVNRWRSRSLCTPTSPPTERSAHDIANGGTGHATQTDRPRRVRRTAAEPVRLWWRRELPDFQPEQHQRRWHDSVHFRLGASHA